MSDQPPLSTSPGRRIYLETFGCQMNELDSELVHDHLVSRGFEFIEAPDDADVILYNTCSVREQAENKVFSRVGLVSIEKDEGRQVVLGVIGCLAEREGEAMFGRFPQVDLLCGPGELDKLPALIENALLGEAMKTADRVALQGGRTRRSATLSAAADNLEMLDLSRAFNPDRSRAAGRSAYVRITRGCNKFCTYCVVPQTRGPEVHRPPDTIVDECRKLADAGVIEVTLLGQTVNHYMYTHGISITANGRSLPQIGPGAAAFKAPGSLSAAGQRVTTFADLLKRIHDEVPGIQRLRFVTSYPRDFGDDILQVMAESPRICRYLHIPAQSGSNRILKLMNRGYTVEEYIDFIDRARKHMPDVCIAGDIIVGFCTETDADFEATKDLVRRVRYKNNFIFKYSPRPGTVAIDRLSDDVPEPVKRKRNNDLLALQAEISAEAHAECVGTVQKVFVDQVSKKSAKAAAAGAVEIRIRDMALEGHLNSIQLSGRTGGDLITVFDVLDQAMAEEMIGQVVPVRIIGSGPLILRGELAEAFTATSGGSSS